MSAFDRVLAALKRISPPWPSLDADKSTGKEMGSIAVALAMAADRVDIALGEIFPDTTSQLLDRWEAITRNAVRTSDSDPTRQARVLSVLRRVAGPRIAQLESVLLPLLATDASNIVWVEPLRSMIEEALTETTGAVALAVPTTAPSLTVQLGRPWPGLVDDFGVMVYLALSTVGVTVATLTSPSGTSWTIPVTGSGWYQTRTVFKGQTAGGTWTLAIRDSTAPTLSEFRLLVSNDVDSSQIYNFFLFRDPTLAGTPDLLEAQRQFKHTALGNMRAFIIETLVFKAGDAHSLMGRDPIGA